MFRITASRSVARTALAGKLHATTPRAFTSQIWTAAKRPQQLALAKPLPHSRLESGSSSGKTVDSINFKEEAKVAAKKLTPHPELVSTKSSVHAISSELGVEEARKETDMMAGIKQDMNTIRETFSLDAVPREAYYIGLAGFLPYLATSLSTVYCAWEIKTNATTGMGFLLNDKQAELMLHILEPLQIGYGITIISFLGAIHWGLEFAGYGGKHGYRRYAIGVAATALAWPTILLPAESALISQFLIFNFLYYNDSRAAKRGQAPPWYGVYRFVLTFIVGSAIVVSLVGRGQIADLVSRPNGPAEKIRQLRDLQAGEHEEEEKAKRQAQLEADEADEDEGDDEAEEEESDDKESDDKKSDDKE